jgi:hypothetical protein
MTCKVCRSFAVQNRAARPDVPFQPEVDCSEEGVSAEATGSLLPSNKLSHPGQATAAPTQNHYANEPERREQAPWYDAPQDRPGLGLADRI